MAASKEKAEVTLCHCGCGKRTSGSTFAQGHDQRLRGMLIRGETLKPFALKFVLSQGVRSEWQKLRARGKEIQESKPERTTKRPKSKPQAKARRQARKVKVQAAESAAAATA
jgi:hypothetical protein